MNTLDGLPTHPMLVHLPIVLGPLLAAATIALVVRPAWRPRWLKPVAVANLLLFLFTLLLVKRSGEFLADVLKEQLGSAIEEHEELGEQTTMLTFFMFAGSAALAVVERLRRQPGDSVTAQPNWTSPAASIVGALTAIVAVVMVIWMFRSGHSAGKIVWGGIPGIA